MDDFISEIHHIPTDWVIRYFSKQSIAMFKAHEYTLSVTLSFVRYRKVQTGTILLSAWDIPNIIYLSVKNSNDFRRPTRKLSPPYLINLYRGYDNRHSIADQIADSDINTLFRALLGMTSEQFSHQNLSLIFEKFNRDYYILLASNKGHHQSTINVDSIIKEVLGLSADDYILALITTFGLCMQYVDPLSAAESLGYIESVSKEQIASLVKYYSCTYGDLRNTSIGKQLLHSKPFIQTQKDRKYLSASVFLVAMLVGNGLYWIIRDYYRKHGTQQFINTFGLLFEDYIKDLASKYCSPFEWNVIPAGHKKGADFVFTLGNVQFLVETKSTLLKLDVKQQVPNLKSVDVFFRTTIQKAYAQLNSSYAQLRPTAPFPILKIILLYDEFSNTSIIETSMSEIFGTDPLCFVMTIREFEILLYLHHNDKTKERIILDALLSSSSSVENRRNVGTIYADLGIWDNPHLCGEMDYFHKFMTQLSLQ